VASRRRFLKIAASGAAAVMVGSLASAQAAVSERGEGELRHADLEAEIEKQKGNVAKTLQTIRAYELPGGSEPDFVFVPLGAKDSEASR